MTEIRNALGHRFRVQPDGNEVCLGCGYDGVGKLTECRPGRPRCGESGCDNPSDVKEFIGGERFDFCGPCRVGARERVRA